LHPPMRVEHANGTEQKLVQLGVAANSGGTPL